MLLNNIYSKHKYLAMKREELKEYIKGKIREKLYAGPSSAATIKSDPNYMKVKDKTAIDAELKKGGAVELEEMARNSIIYKVSPNFRELAKNVKTGGPISPQKLKAVIDFVDGKENITGPEIAAGVGFPGQMPRIYPIFAGLIKAGAIISSKEDKTIPDEDEETIEPEVDNKDNVGNEEAPTSDEPPVAPKPQASPEAAAFIRSKAEAIKAIIKSYKGSRGRIYNLDEAPEYRDYMKTLEKSQEANLAKYERTSSELANEIKKLKPEIQDEVLALLNDVFKAAGFDMIGSLLSSKAGKNPKPGGVPSYDDDEEDELDSLDFDEDEEDEINEDEKILITRRSPEEREKNHSVVINKKIQEYIKNGSRHSLDLNSTPITSLPSNLTTVGGNFNLEYSSIISLPDNLTVEGSLNLNDTPITLLPKNLTVKGYLFLSGTKISSLPSDLKAGGINANNTPITSLPKGLEVRGDLQLSGTRITSLPSDLKVGRDFDISDTPLSKKYTEEQIKQMCPGVKGKIFLK